MTEEVRSVAALEVAEQMLAEIASVDDARHLINMAEMARVYARQSKLGTSAINHATVIKIRAERRLADVVDEGQARGEIAGAGQPENSAQQAEYQHHRAFWNGRPAKLPELGIDSSRLAEARILRDSYTDEQIAERQAEADEREEILSRQKLIQEARAENDRNGVIQQQRIAGLFPVYEALDALAAVEEDATAWAARVPEYSAYRVTQRIDAAHAWLTTLKEAWNR